MSEDLAEAAPDGYEALFHGHFWGLVRLARLLGADDPEDVVQEAFVRLHRKRGGLRDQNAALAYLRSSVCNACRSRLRHLRIARRRHARMVEPSESGSAEQSAVEHEMVRDLLAAVDGLAARQREVIVLRYWLDLNERETAETMGIALGTVKAHTARAIAALAKQVKDAT
ncbi:sigma-70 family RNA polymerase sigma factor [Spirillospora sp. CA-294931]|uniref:sigma-70 family RNA polymerase sigma factor n=1 Tax=Spirillospora sp. CA-294931 TaxID=3240042 RepID=UPI003D90E8CA